MCVISTAQDIIENVDGACEKEVSSSFSIQLASSSSLTPIFSVLPVHSSTLHPLTPTHLHPPTDLHER